MLGNLVFHDSHFSSALLQCEASRQNGRKTIRQSISLPTGVAAQVRSMARTQRLSANRMLADQGPLPALGFYAEKVDHYPEGQRDASSHLRRMIRAEEASGCQRVGDTTKMTLSEVSFVRADCQDRKVHEVVLVATHNAWALVFIFQASDTHNGRPAKPSGADCERTGVT